MGSTKALAHQRVYMISRYGTHPKGGVERVVRLVVDDLAQRHYEVVLVDEEKVVPQWLRHARLGQFIFPTLASLWLRLQRRQEPYFLTISNTSYTPFYPADVVIVHGSAVGYADALAQTGKRFLGMRLLGRFEALSMRAARANACVSEAVRELAIKRYGVASSKCTVVHNGIDTSIFNLRPKFVGPTVRFGFAGRLETGKGLAYLHDLAMWISTQADLRLVLATIGPVPEAFHTLDNVTLMQDVPPERMAEFYDNIDIFLLPSLFEGFELVTLEAIASGVYVMGNRVGACREFLDRGVPWVYELPPTAAGFINTVPALFDELRRQHDARVMRAFIDDSFSTERFCSQIRALL